MMRLLSLFLLGGLVILLILLAEAAIFSFAWSQTFAAKGISGLPQDVPMQQAFWGLMLIKIISWSFAVARPSKKLKED